MQKYRTLIRIEHVSDSVVTIVVPGWSSRVLLFLDRSSIPLQLKKGKYIRRVHAQANLNAVTVDQFDFSDWEEE